MSTETEEMLANFVRLLIDKTKQGKIIWKLSHGQCYYFVKEPLTFTVWYKTTGVVLTIYHKNKKKVIPEISMDPALYDLYSAVEDQFLPPKIKEILLYLERNDE